MPNGRPMPIVVNLCKITELRKRQLKVNILYNSKEFLIQGKICFIFQKNILKKIWN